ncbi:hypothetical protein D4A92_19895 [Rhizobium rosettiformans]|uniref:DUF2274 domain-containing protein n=1 Tax=Rhizobium rosettiformans TaxID=1368430 RepID=A0ABX7EZ09_9HYPH|nr:hypothetical protein [Rhizobium rosettiformans]QRF53550.1 hypothetical protein D4A92_19895 [Rhizobium rosettiformans]
MTAKHSHPPLECVALQEKYEGEVLATSEGRTLVIGSISIDLRIGEDRSYDAVAGVFEELLSGARQAFTAFLIEEKIR